MIVLPISRRSSSVRIKRSLSRWCKPMVGSSRTYSAPTNREPSCDAKRIRCASPPDSVLAVRLSAKYSNPTLSKKFKRSSISFVTATATDLSLGESLRCIKKLNASSTDMEVRSTTLIPRTVPSLFVEVSPRNTFNASGRRRLP